jgi:hypothetical protein
MQATENENEIWQVDCEEPVKVRVTYGSDLVKDEA